MTSNAPVKIGVVGLGGYAHSIISLIRNEYPEHPRQFELVAVCSNDFHKFPDRVAELRASGIECIEDMDAFLRLPFEVVWLPVPIPLHRPFTEKALAAGKIVVTEKPAAGVVDDVDAMIAAREKYGRPVAVGFQDVYDRTTLPLKREILSGRIGQVKSATVMACWPRSNKYYGRASWAGAFKIGEHWVMDSPANNALSHYMNIPLFLLGLDEASTAQVKSIEAELYRANPIENYDTCALRLHLTNGVPLLVLFTHACMETHNPVIRIDGTKGTITRSNSQIVIETPQGTQEIPRDHMKTRYHMLQRLANLARNIPDTEHGLATLEVARAQVLAVNAASEASPVHQISPDHFTIRAVESGDTFHHVGGIEELFKHCAKHNVMPHESGLASWTKPAGVKDGLEHYTHFSGPKL